jgi:hypothetical protein
MKHVELIFFKGKKREKIAYLLIWVDEKGKDIQQAWNLSADDKKKVSIHYGKFKEHVQPTLNPVFARYRFKNETQGSDSIDKFVTRLRLRANDCRYSDKEDELIQDRIVFWHK